MRVLFSLEFLAPTKNYLKKGRPFIMRWECPLAFRRVSDTLSLFDRVRKVEFCLLQHTETGRQTR